MNHEKLETLLNDIGGHLSHPTRRSEALSAKLQLCVALHWLGSGAQYHTVGDMHGISKASVCRCIHRVVQAINDVKFPQVITWPENIMNVVEQFHGIAGFPQVIGCVDGTLIKIDRPTENEANFVDRFGNHSLNCMVVCGPDCSFYYVSARWPGSVNDARVLRNSSLNERMEGGWRPIPGSVILGDSIYPLKDWLIPPLNDVQDPVVIAFNRAHKSTRRVVENSLGILKEKFPCLNYLRVDPVFAANIFKCCTSLCNIARNEEDTYVPEIELEENPDAVEIFPENEAPAPNARERIEQLLN